MRQGCITKVMTQKIYGRVDKRLTAVRIHLSIARTQIMRLLIAYPHAATWSWSSPINATICGFSVDGITAALSEDTEVLVTDAMPGAEVSAPGLKWIHLMSAGYNQAIGHPLALRPGVRVSNAAGLCAGHMAEFAVGQMLRHVKRFDDFSAKHHLHEWPDRTKMATPSLRGRRAVIVGYGGVGRETARLFTSLGVLVDVVQRGTERASYGGYLPFPGMGDPEGMLPRRIFTLDNIDMALADADFVILTVPLTPRTRHLINQRSLAAMKPGAVLINMARGGLVEMGALEQALKSRHLNHAYLDVFETEPLPTESAIWEIPHLTITPHMSGVIPGAAELQEDLLKHNLNRYRNGEPLLNEIEREKLEA